MRTKFYCYLGGVILLTLLSGWWIRTSAPVEAAPVRSKPMFLATANDLEVGSFIEARDLIWRPWPTQADETVLARHFVKGIAKPDDLVGSVLRVALKQNDFIDTTSSVRLGDAAFLAAVLKPGLRAITIPVDRISGSAGLMQPGNFVDVILAGRPQDSGRRKSPAARTLLTNIRVIAINQRVENLATIRSGKELVAPDPFSSSNSSLDHGTATLEVSPKQAELLALARNVGDISLSLRSLVPHSDVDIDATATRELISGMLEPAPQATAADSTAEVVQLLGTTRRPSTKDNTVSLSPYPPDFRQ